MSIVGASIIIWFYDDKLKLPILLTGKESIYVSDLNKTNPLFKEKFETMLREKETFQGTDLMQAKMYFSKGAKELEDGIGMQTIKFDTPILKGDSYTVNFRYLPETFKRGVIKGGIEGSETPAQAILRETAEELGINIKEKNLVNLGVCEGNQVYSLNIGKESYDFFTKRIKEREIAKSGEVFDLSFKPLNFIESQLLQHNKKSICAISLFKGFLEKGMKGGKVKKRNKTLRNKRKTIDRRKKYRKSKKYL